MLSIPRPRVTVAALLTLIVLLLPSVAAAQVPAVFHLSAWPNPIQSGAATEIYIDLGESSQVEILIQTESGTLVRSVANRTLPALRTILPYDGKDSQGRALTAGHYQVVANVTVNGERSTFKAPLYVQGGAAPAPEPVQTQNFDAMINEAFQIALGAGATSDNLRVWNEMLNANPSMRSVSAILNGGDKGQSIALETRIKQEQGVRNGLFQRAWLDVWGYGVNTPPPAWDNLIRSKGLWYVTVLRALRVERSYSDIFGRAPNDGELAYWMSLSHDDSRVQSLQSLKDNHIRFLQDSPGARDEVVRRSYQAVFGRQPDEGELSYWVELGAYTYPQLVETHKLYLGENWPGIIADSYWVVFGRTPSAGEREYWVGQSPMPLPEMVQNHFRYLTANRDVRATVIRDSYIAAFGRDATSGEVDYWLGQSTQTYWTLLELHKQYLAESWPTTIKESYAAVFGRSATSGEVSYWQSQTPRTVQSMIQNHLQYLAGDRGGAWVNLVQDSYYAAFGRPASDEELAFWINQPISTFHSLVASHRAWLASQPVATPPSQPRLANGTPVVVPTSPGLLQAVSRSSLVGNDGASLVGNDGASIITDNGAGLVGNDGASLVGNDGASLVGNDGASLIGLDGSTIIPATGGSLIGLDGSTLIGLDGSTAVANSGR